MEAVSRAHRIYVEGPLGACNGVSAPVDAGEDGSSHPLFIVALDPNEDVPVKHRNAAAREGGAVRDSLPEKPRSVAKRGKGRAGSGRRRRSRLRHRHHLDPSRHELARHLEIERPVAGDEHPRARGHPIRAGQGLGRAGGHYAGKRPAGDRMRPLVRPGGDDELARAVAARAAVHEDLDLRSGRARCVARIATPARVGSPHRGGVKDLHPRGPDPHR